jgi:hypothetical protein
MMLTNNFTLKPWLRHWFLWVGIVSILSLNLIGIIYLYWYGKMKRDGNYAPVAIIVVHAIMSLFIIILAIAFIGYNINNHSNIRIFHYTWLNPPTYILALVSFVLLTISSTPLFGIRYNTSCRKDMMQNKI